MHSLLTGATGVATRLAGYNKQSCSWVTQHTVINTHAMQHSVREKWMHKQLYNTVPCHEPYHRCCHHTLGRERYCCCLCCVIWCSTCSACDLTKHTAQLPTSGLWIRTQAQPAEPPTAAAMPQGTAIKVALLATCQDIPALEWLLSASAAAAHAAVPAVVAVAPATAAGGGSGGVLADTAPLLLQLLAPAPRHTCRCSCVSR